MIKSARALIEDFGGLDAFLRSQQETDAFKLSLLKTVGDSLASLFTTVRSNNTAEWMEEAVARINRWNEVTGDPDRVAVRQNSLEIVKGGE